MNILITGGAGYIGSHVLKALLEKNSDKITVIDNFYSGSRDALVALESVGKFEFIKCDLADTDLLEEIFSTVPGAVANTQFPESTAAFLSIPVPTTGASVTNRGTA